MAVTYRLLFAILLCTGLRTCFGAATGEATAPTGGTTEAGSATGVTEFSTGAIKKTVNDTTTPTVSSNMSSTVNSTESSAEFTTGAINDTLKEITNPAESSTVSPTGSSTASTSTNTTASQATNSAMSSTGNTTDSSSSTINPTMSSSVSSTSIGLAQTHAPANQSSESCPDSINGCTQNCQSTNSTCCGCAHIEDPEYVYKRDFCFCCSEGSSCCPHVPGSNPVCCPFGYACELKPNGKSMFCRCPDDSTTSCLSTFTVQSTCESDEVDESHGAGYPNQAPPDYDVISTSMPEGTQSTTSGPTSATSTGMLPMANLNATSEINTETPATVSTNTAEVSTPSNDTESLPTTNFNETSVNTGAPIVNGTGSAWISNGSTAIPPGTIVYSSNTQQAFTESTEKALSEDHSTGTSEVTTGKIGQSG